MQRFSKAIKSSVGSGSFVVEFLVAVPMQSRASLSGLVVNSDFTLKK